MMKNYIGLFLLVFWISGCNSGEVEQTATRGNLEKPGKMQFHTPEQYNNYITTLQMEIYEGFMDVAQAMGEGDSVEIRKKIENLEATIEENKMLVSQMNDFGGDSTLRDNAVELFGFYEEVLEKDYNEMANLIVTGSAETETGKEKIKDISTSLSSREAKVDQKFRNTQEKFARNFNMPLQQNPVQEFNDSLREEVGK